MKWFFTIVELTLVPCFAIAQAAPGHELMFAATGTNIKGPLSVLESGWSATIGGKRLPAGSLIEMVQVGKARPPWPDDRPQLLLVNGDRWPGQVLDIQDDRVRFAPDFGARRECTLPVSAIAVASIRSAESAIKAGKRSTDEARLVNGDVIRGTLTALDAHTLTIEVNGKKQSAPRDGIAALAFNTDLARHSKTKSAGRIVLADGTRVTLADAALRDGSIVGKSVAGPTVQLLLEDVVVLTVTGGSATELSDLEHVKYEHIPYLGATWPLMRNLSVGGGPLRLGGDTFDRGVGLHSRSRVTYDIPPGAQRFESWVGLDAVTGRLGRAIVLVEWDGKLAWGPRELSGGRPPERVELPVPAGAKVITLVVDFGPGGDVQDHVNFADARFVRSQSR